MPFKLNLSNVPKRFKFESVSLDGTTAEYSCPLGKSTLSAFNTLMKKTGARRVGLITPLFKEDRARIEVSTIRNTDEDLFEPQ